MTATVPALPQGFDPLIAEAKRRAHRRRLVIAFVVVAIAAALGTTLSVRQKALAPARPQLPSLFTNAGLASGHSWQVRPASILFTGDGSGRLGGLGGTIAHPGHVTWTEWTKTQALGSGAVFTTDRLPNAVVSTFRPTITNAAVRAFRPVDGHFTRLTLRYTYHGRHYSSTFRIRRDGEYWQYAPAAER